MFAPQVDSHGRALIYCAFCIRSGDPSPSQAITMVRGTALCQIHLHHGLYPAPSVASKADNYFNGN